MFHYRKTISGIVLVMAMLVMILDTKNAISGAAYGIDICMKTIIPSLFPFFVLTGYIMNAVSGKSNRVLSAIGRLCKIPVGAEHIYLLGLLGGYPIGAQAVSTAFRQGTIRKIDAERMLGFCNNAGPAFIFGLIGCLFDSIWISWVIWFILIFASFLTGVFLPGECTKQKYMYPQHKQNPIENAIKATAKVCGWIILFRVLITILDRWILWYIPNPLRILIMGILELANGCTELFATENPVFRMTAAVGFLCFGGVCVGLQTMSVVYSLSCKLYWLSKMLQLCIVIPLSYIISSIIFLRAPTVLGIIVSLFCCIGAVIYGILMRKNNSGNYNRDIV